MRRRLAGSAAGTGRSSSGASRAPSCSIPPARAVSAVTTLTERPSSTAAAASLATAALLPAPGGPDRSSEPVGAAAMGANANASARAWARATAGLPEPARCAASSSRRPSGSGSS